MAKEKFCGDCIHADICKKVNGSWYHPKNIAYCTVFKERKICVEVVRCKDCTEWDKAEQECKHWYGFRADDFCSYGERKDNG